jgi:hypothetical protein
MRTQSVTLAAGTITLREWGNPDGLPLLYWNGLNSFGSLEPTRRSQEQPSSAHRQLGREKLPILLVTASHNDTAAERDRFRRSVPHAEVRELESGHDLLADAPDETIALVSEWVRSALPH